MQQAIPYESWTPLLGTPDRCADSSRVATGLSRTGHPGTENFVVNMVTENAVLVIARRGCCMSHVMKRLLLGLGVNPAVCEVEENDEMTVIAELESVTQNREIQGKVQLPAVFIGGKLFGGLDRLMATHISGELIPVLKQAGALWL